MRVYIFVLLLFVFVPPAVAAEDLYMCPMHPHISGEKRDDCPICGMALVPKVENISEGDFKITPSYLQTLGVKTAEVRPQEFGRNIRAFGRIVPSTRLEYAVDVRAKGWVVDLATDAVGDEVTKGDLLFTLYSPDLMTAQVDYLIGSRIGNAEQRLRLHGMGDKAIAALKKKGKFLENTPFYAPVDGSVSMLNVRKGAYVNEGGSVLKIQGFSKVWVDADVSVRDVQFLKIGTPVKVTVSETGEIYESVVDFVHPVNDPKSLTAKVRVVLDNSNGTLMPNTYVDAIFNADVKSRLSVPVESVLYGSIGAYVMESVGDGRFKPVMVDVGITANGLTEIKSGLSKGQRIVTSGQFMLDAESNLRGGVVNMEGGGEHVH